MSALTSKQYGANVFFLNLRNLHVCCETVYDKCQIRFATAIQCQQNKLTIQSGPLNIKMCVFLKFSLISKGFLLLNMILLRSVANTQSYSDEKFKFSQILENGSFPTIIIFVPRVVKYKFLIKNISDEMKWRIIGRNW